jgi:hypothetical protein
MARKGFPRSHSALIAEGYRFASAASCRDCGGPVWWYVTPLGRRLAVDAVTHRPHFWKCPPRARKAEALSPPPQMELFPW